MNIAIGKIGRSCYFSKKRWSIFAGDDTPLILYFELCRQYPQHTFYMIGASDVQRCKKEGIEFPSNFVDVWGDMKNEVGKQFGFKKSGKYPWQQLLEYVNKINLKLDFGIILQGPDMMVSIEGVGIKLKKNPEKDIHPLCIGINYVAPIIALINDKKFPWVILNEDPRYVPIMIRDIVHDELCVLSQNNDVCEVERISGYGEKALIHRKHKIIYKYAAPERLFFRDFKKIDFRDPNNIKVGDKTYQKKNTFIMTVNGGYDRLGFVEKWVFDHKPDQIVYGKWDDAAKEKHPNNFIEKGIIDLNPELWESKFTFVPALQKSRSGFVTQKPWKMIYFGIIPFFDKKSYDTDRLEPFPDFCYVESPEEMWKKINALEKNPEAYKKLLNHFYDLLEDRYFDGTFIHQMFDKFITKFDKNA